MQICIVGGGKLGYHLAKTLLEHGHRPILIEADEKAAMEAANGLDIPVIHGDGTSVAVLQKAEIKNCPAFVCVTGRDEVNLIAAQLAKKIFHVKKTIARVNNPKNTAALKRLGVDVVVSATYTLARLLEQEVETTAMRHLLELGRGGASVVEITLPEHFAFDGKTLAELSTPKECVIISILRKGAFIIPGGDTAIFSNDHLMVVSTENSLHKLAHLWGLQ